MKRLYPKKLPKTIKEHKMAWLLKPPWLRMHTTRQQFNCVFCGEPGSGKTYASMTMAYLLDRSSDDVPRFTIDKVAFNAEQFATLAREKMPIGSAIILDDASLVAYSADALKREVKAISKIFHTMRHQRKCVLLTIPSLKLLAKSVKMVLMNYVEMLEPGYGKFQSMQMNPKQGKIYYRRPIKWDTKINSLTGMPIKVKKLINFIGFDHPPIELANAYEQIREKQMEKHYDDALTIVSGKKKKEHNTFQEDFKIIKKNKKKFIGKNKKVDYKKLLLAGLSEGRAKAITGLLNEKKESVCVI